MSEAKLSEQLYRWTGDDGGHQIGRKVSLPLDEPGCGEAFYLMRCEHGRLWWVRGKLESHDTTYREKEKEAERVM